MNNKRILFVLLFFICNRILAQNNNILVKEEALKSAISFLNLIPEGREKDYGFDSRNDFSQIKIEEPYQIYYLNYENNELGFTTWHEWRVPISVNGVYKTLLAIQVFDGKTKCFDLGGNKLAQKIQEIEKLHLSKLNQHVIIRNTILNQDFMPSNFSALCDKIVSDVEFKINKNAIEPIFQINESAPIKTSIAQIINDTQYLIKNKSDK